MKDLLPYADFQWEENVNDIDIMNIASDSERGYILEVDLEYPSEYHDSHNQYPLAPDHFIPTITEILQYNDHIG